MIPENVTNSIESSVSDKSDSLFCHFDDVFLSITTLRSQITIIQQKLKGLEKTVKKEVKQLKKDSEKKKTRQKKKPSGFAKPSKITHELCEFMTRPVGTELARTEVTKYLIKYIQSNNLQNPENKKIIRPDDKLKTLLEIDETTELTYFNLQKFMNKHFQSSPPS